MNKIVVFSLSFILSGCAVNNVRPQAKPYDNPKEGYVVYTPKAGYQQWDGIYLRGFNSKGMNYVSNCVATTSITPSKNLQASLRFVEDDGVVYLSYIGGPRFASCEINYSTITTEVEQYIAKQKTISQARAEKEVAASERLKKVRKDDPKGSATTDSIELFVKYCEALKDATGNASYIDALRGMRHEYVGPETNRLMYIYAKNLFQNTGGIVYCQYAIPQVKERIYSLGIDPTK